MDSSNHGGEKRTLLAFLGVGGHCGGGDSDSAVFRGRSSEGLEAQNVGPSDVRGVADPVNRNKVVSRHAT